MTVTVTHVGRAAATGSHCATSSLPGTAAAPAALELLEAEAQAHRQRLTSDFGTS